MAQLQEQLIFPLRLLLWALLHVSRKIRITERNKSYCFYCVLDDPDEADYIPSTVSLAFDLHTHNLNVCGNFVIVDDNLPPTVAEDDEYFLVSLSTSDNADIIPEQTTAKVVIHDNDGA